METSYRGKTPMPGLELLLYRKKALRIINNQPKNSHSGPLFKQNYILKFRITF